MRQMPEVKKKPVKPIPKKLEDDKKKVVETASSFATKETKGKDKYKKKVSFDYDDEITCYCCGDPDCRLPRCDEEGTRTKSQWHKPKHFKESYQKQNHQAGVH